MKNWTPLQRISWLVGILWLLQLMFRNELRQLTGWPGEVNWLDGTVIAPIPIGYVAPGWVLLMLNFPVILMLGYTFLITKQSRELNCGDRFGLLILVLLQMGALFMLPGHADLELAYPCLLGIPVCILLMLAFWTDKGRQT